MLLNRLILLSIFCSFATRHEAQTIKKIKPVLELQMPLGNGSNGASVVWHPVLKKYYTAFAGNADFPLAVFDEKGNRLSNKNMKTGFDVRGLLYDYNSSLICGNAYSDAGWFKLNLDGAGMPTSVTNILASMNQPKENSVGVMAICAEGIAFLDGQEIIVYDDIDDYSIRLYPGKAKQSKILTNTKESVPLIMPSAYNGTVAICTEMLKAEFGLLNVLDKQIELYDMDTGLMTQILELPTDAPANAVFNFAFTNDIYWLFDKTARRWIGYK